MPIADTSGLDRVGDTGGAIPDRK